MSRHEKEVRATLRIVKFDPMSLIRTGFLISVSIAVTMLTATLVMYVVLAGMGVFESIDSVLGDLTGSSAGLTETFTLPVVFFSSVVIGIFEIITTTSLFALFGFVYNATVPATSGLAVTLAEDQVQIESE
ncbi:MAG: DUF3566 domain-containing protein [Actinobacteria bacterium]|jgi:hypothetical protein|nr:DUF3566 domain-containing protein [Actinomycetota bacterium]